jgi:hypothetical protein
MQTWSKRVKAANAIGRKVVSPERARRIMGIKGKRG